MMTVYPMARGTLVNFAAFRAKYDLEHTTLEGPAVQHVSRDEFAQDFDGWEPEAQALIEVRRVGRSLVLVSFELIHKYLQCVPTASRWAVHTVLPLQSFVAESGQAVLLGDAVSNVHSPM